MNLKSLDATNLSLSLNKLPEHLQLAIGKALNENYGELYEEDADYTTSLEDSLREILGLLHSSYPILGHLRYVWMALILSLTVQPTITYYQPDNPLPDYTINRMSVWIIETLEEILYSPKKLSRITKDESINEIKAILDNFFSCKTTKPIPSLQILLEALDVYQNALKMIDYDQSLEALLEILDDCLEGYAIFSGSYGRRELFNWWLLEVVPASWYLLPPPSIYCVDIQALETGVEIQQMKILKSLSDKMWNIILECYLEEKNRYMKKTMITLQDSFYLSSITKENTIKYQEKTLNFLLDTEE